MAFIFMKFFRAVILVCLLGSIIQYLINNKSYTFSPRELRRIAELYSGQHPRESAFKISNDLRRKYHPHVIPDNEQQWRLGWYGGITYKYLVLHVSVTEALWIVGSPLRMHGSVGSQWMNQSCTVLSGSVHAFRSGPLALREEYGPGEYYRQGMGETLVIGTSEETWLLCYHRGFVLASAPLGLASNILGGADVVEPAKAVAQLAPAFLREIALSISETIQAQLAKLGLGGK